MRTRASFVVASAIGLSLLLSGCVFLIPLPSPPVSAAQKEWDDAYAYLSEQTKPWEILCFTPQPEGADPNEAEPLQFFSFSDRSKWEPYLFPPRADQDPDQLLAQGLACGVNIPISVPYTEQDIEGFLNPLGLYFFDVNASSGLTYTEINYAGAVPGNSQVIYPDSPALWGAAIALSSIQNAAGELLAFDNTTATIIQPANDQEAQRWLTAVQPLLDWYGYGS